MNHYLITRKSFLPNVFSFKRSQQQTVLLSSFSRFFASCKIPTITYYQKEYKYRRDNTVPTTTTTSSIPSIRFFSSKIEFVPLEKIRNVAIIAHVDHGKTTLVDSILRQGGVVLNNTRLLDKNDLEKERGITILAKTTRLNYKGYILNVVDTPGHASFGGEVERTLSMIDGVLLVIDLHEGPAAQTKFVLSKAIRNPKIVPIVIVNKCDRSKNASEGEIDNAIFELFTSLEMSDHQMDYPTLYGSAKHGWFETSWEDVKKKEHPEGISPLLDLMIHHIPPPSLSKEHGANEAVNESIFSSLQFLQNPVSNNFSFLASIIEHIQGVGHCVTGKVYSGFALPDARVFALKSDGGPPVKSVLKSIYITEGIDKVTAPIASSGDICSLLFQPALNVHDTVVASVQYPALPFPTIDPPVLEVTVSPNSSPLQGKDGKFTSLNDIDNKIKYEATINLGLEVARNNTGGISVCGRGALQLAILFETMRRNDYEFEVSPPEVVTKKDENGKLLEPWEKIRVVMPVVSNAAVLEVMMRRNVDLVANNVKNETAELVFECSSRQFFGMHDILLDVTKREAQISSEFLGYRPLQPYTPPARNKLVIATDAGLVTGPDMIRFQDDCRYFVYPGTEVYEGQILGYSLSNRPDDVCVNITKGKKVKVMTQRSKENIPNLIPPVPTSIDFFLGYIHSDEIIEVTPKRVVLRKKILSNHDRQRIEKGAKKGKL